MASGRPASSPPPDGPAHDGPAGGGAADGVPCRWLPTVCLAGEWQMAIDLWLLAQPGPAFRLYRWRRPTLSIGYHQRRLPQHWLELAAAGSIDLVRRPTGGRAVLHGGDLCYALVWPQPPQRRLEAYAAASAWLLEAFLRLGQPLRQGRRAASLASANCFALGTGADLVHADGSKRVGSAQLWRSGRLLQHGSIQLLPPEGLWQQLFGEAPPALGSLPGDMADLEAVCLDAARRQLPFEFTAEAPRPLRADELAGVIGVLDAAAVIPTSPQEAGEEDLAGDASAVPEAAG